MAGVADSAAVAGVELVSERASNFGTRRLQVFDKDSLLRVGVFIADAVVLAGVLALVDQAHDLAVLTCTQAALWVIAPWRVPLSPHGAGGATRVLFAFVAIQFAYALVGVSFAASTAVIMAAAVVFERSLMQAAIAKCKARGRLQQPTLVIGTGPVAEQVVEALREHREYGCLPVHAPDLAPDAPWSIDAGDSETIASLITSLRVRRVFVVGTQTGTVVVEPRCDLFLVLCNETEPLLARRADDHVWGIPVVRIPRAPALSPMFAVKRIFDVVGACVGLALTAPVFLLTGLAVKVTSRGPIFFRQTRVGENGRLITITKFRTMREPTELNLESVDAASAEDWQRMQHEDARKRETKIGRVLRATSLDELPQLLDIVRGDLSLVGPRPELPHQVVNYSGDIDGYSSRHRMPAGLTGWAQVHGLRGETSLTERARFDNYYIDTWSIMRDASIVLLTLTVVIRDAVRSFMRRAG